MITKTKNITIKIDYLNEITKKIKQTTNDILGLRDRFDVVVDEDEALQLVKALEMLKIAIETTPIE